MNVSWVEQEKIITTKLKNLISEKIYKLKDKTMVIITINEKSNKKYTKKNFNTLSKIRNIISNIDWKILYQINLGENFKIIKENFKPNLDIKNVKQYIIDKKLNLSCSIYQNNKNIFNYNNQIYAMHSIGKVFTGIIIILLLNDKIINDIDLNSPLQIDPEIFDKLPQKVANRLKTTTMLDVMTHMSGIKDYLGKYLEHLELNNKINPYEPEDFIEYIDDSVYKKNIFNYSNAGILLCGLSIKYLYNKKNNTNKSYNDILFDYIIKPAKLKSFSISCPKNGTYNKDDKIAKYINGSPGGGYWITSNDLALFGNFLLNEIINKKIVYYLKKYGREFYEKNIIRHGGGINGSSCYLKIYLKNNISISIMDNDGMSSNILYDVEEIFR